MVNDLEQEIQSIGERLSQVEMGSRRWRSVVVFLACALGVAFLAGAQAPLADVVKAKSFVLVDDDGVPRAELRIHTRDPELGFFNGDGKSIPLALSARSGGPEIVLSSSRNAATITVGDDGPTLSLADSAGYVAMIGHMARAKRQDGTETESSGVSIALSDVRGKILWSAP